MSDTFWQDAIQERSGTAPQPHYRVTVDEIEPEGTAQAQDTASWTEQARAAVKSRGEVGRSANGMPASEYLAGMTSFRRPDGTIVQVPRTSGSDLFTMESARFTTMDGTGDQAETMELHPLERGAVEYQRQQDQRAEYGHAKAFWDAPVPGQQLGRIDPNR